MGCHLSWALKVVVKGLLNGGPLHCERGAVVEAYGMEGSQLTSRLLEEFSPLSRSSGELNSLLLLEAVERWLQHQLSPTSFRVLPLMLVPLSPP